MVPFLNLEPILQAPAGHPVTEAEAIQLIWGAVNSNFRGFRGYSSCQVVGRKGICLEQGGCEIVAPSPCPCNKYPELKFILCISETNKDIFDSLQVSCFSYLKKKSFPGLLLSFYQSVCAPSRLLHPQHLDRIWIRQDQYRLP